MLTVTKLGKIIYNNVHFVLFSFDVETAWLSINLETHQWFKQKISILEQWK